jgi:hypothetical protein
MEMLISHSMPMFRGFPTDGARAMTVVNDVLTLPQSQLLEEEQSNFMGLQDGEIDIISQEAVARAIAQKEALGLPITVWNNGNPYRKYPDGRIEHIQV